VALFVAIFCLILSMYGGGFATIPAYLADLFGIRYVGAIHGRLLTAWSVAGVLGPLLVNAIRQRQIDAGVPPAAAYNMTMYLLAGMLVAGFIGNLLVRPVSDSRFRSREDETTHTPSRSPASSPSPVPAPAAAAVPGAFESGRWLEVATGWTAVGVPLAWGILRTLQKAALLFE
jgi:hypothetical protein